MFTGEEKWCQLFSEPGAGSDFAGLGTKAVRDGDEWIVNGQKVWNTLAHIADWGMLVTRTDPDLPKHKGMTYFALDMQAEGVEVRPLRQITGEAEFNEVYMTDVRVPDDRRIGDRGEGWRAALTTLMNERTAIGGGGGGGTPEARQRRHRAPRRGLDRGRSPRSTAGRPRRGHEAVDPGRGPAPHQHAGRPGGQDGPPRARGLGRQAGRGRAQQGHLRGKAIDLLGMAGQVDYDYTFRRPARSISTVTGNGIGYAFLRVRANSIEGGTSEVMRNILGEQVLGLPGEPRVDKEIAWSKVPKN